MSARLEIAGLTVRVGSLAVLDRVDLTMAAGETVGLIGSNGSGKTTLLNAISGLAAVAAGTIRLDRRDITNAAAHRIAAAGVARTFQTPRVFQRMTVIDNVRPTLRAVAEAELDHLLVALELASRRYALAAELTLAETRRLELARALAIGPRLLVLDEPTAGLTSRESEEIISALTALRPAAAATIVVEHRFDVLRDLAPRLVVLDQGTKIADGPREDVVRDPVVRRGYLGMHGS